MLMRVSIQFINGYTYSGLLPNCHQLRNNEKLHNLMKKTKKIFSNSQYFFLLSIH
jgi:hypothetical protein